LHNDNAVYVAQTLVAQKRLYSAGYFKVVEEVFKLPTTSTCLINTIDNFFDFIKEQTDTQLTKDMMLYYAGLDNNYNFSTLKTQLNELETEAGHQFPNA
jgi:hypothetical protein